MLHHRGRPAERSLIRDLIVLQKTRSLRDPSTSPPIWPSRSIVGGSTGKHAKSTGLRSGKRLTDVDIGNELERLSVSSSRFPNVVIAKVTAAGESSSCHGIGDGVHDAGLPKPMKKETRRKKSKDPGDVAARHKSISRKSACGKKVPVKPFSEQLEVPVWKENENRKVCHRHHQRSQRMEEKRAKKQGCHVARTLQGLSNPRDDGGCGGSFVTSKSVAESSVCHSCYAHEPEEEATFVTQGLRHGCGPWHWSRIHHRGKIFPDTAESSLSRSLSDSRLMKAESLVIQRQGNTSYIASALDHLCISTSSNSEAQALCTESIVSQKRAADRFWGQLHPGEYTGMLDFNLGSEQTSGNQQRSEGDHCSRYLILMQKYAPKTFNDIVGQNLVIQVLANAISKRKVGSVYVFYGPHGTGKTSCAHIFAKALSCHSEESPKPCDICASCISHNLGKSRDMMEVVEFERIMVVLDDMIFSPLPSDYKVFIIEDCDKLPPDSWITISKVIDRAPQSVVFVLVCSKLDHLPHMILSRCQKFFFPKLKDGDIIYALQRISTTEGLEIENDVFKFIASSSDGSLRDAIMALDQLSLLEQKISVAVVEELVGSISSEKLVDLLDSALSGDTATTLMRLRAIMETRVDPVALLSQLAMVITDIFAGTYVLPQERLERNFFCRPTLSKEDIEKLRQALKILTQTERMLRSSNDKLTCLASSLLQLTSDQQLMPPSCSLDNITSNRTSDTPTTDTVSRRTNRNCLNQNQQAGHTSYPRLRLTEARCTSNIERCSGSAILLKRFSTLDSIQTTKEVTEVEDSHQGHEYTKHVGGIATNKGKGVSNAWMEESPCLQHLRRANIEQPQRHGLVRSKTSLSDVIKQSKLCAPRGGWSGLKMISISEKPEHDNLGLARSLFCWRSSGITKWKGPHVRIRSRKRRSFVKFAMCGRFLCTKSLRAY